MDSFDALAMSNDGWDQWQNWGVLFTFIAVAIWFFMGMPGLPPEKED
jgi:hypothetical protein